MDGTMHAHNAHWCDAFYKTKEARIRITLVFIFLPDGFKIFL